MKPADRVWLFDLDNTLHDAGAWVFPALHASMGDFTARTLALDAQAAQDLNHHYWHHYGATLLGLIRHHGVKPMHFLHDTHRLPGLEQRLDGHRHDFAALARLRGRKFILTNAPRHYALRVLGALGITHLFDGVIGIDQMQVFGQLRPKPDARMLRTLAVRLRVPPQRCVLVEDTLEHLKSARRVGMGTVWMQRFVRRGVTLGPRVARLSMRPAYVQRVVRGLRPLLRGGMAAADAG
ncbi:pyrimidine 5'-nucleotidase [Aquabacterium sp. OR-4]|uniref:pyrimidine 5'-nucleotidase n=1 Tax=Aquabacterium sp. OR-4 TaxID=2978127 RepID=UPI0021B43E02|nr:pyrimidine 5'-nucleotidase [Aquabacterium sp. OR-4]MDT7834563.1 pyrimidine 5'-nucleotidase [Aquabacterium sp. OR-4]